MSLINFFFVVLSSGRTELECIQVCHSPSDSFHETIGTKTPASESFCSLASFAFGSVERNVEEGAVRSPITSSDWVCSYCGDSAVNLSLEATHTDFHGICVSAGRNLGLL